MPLTEIRQIKKKCRFGAVMNLAPQVLRFLWDI